MTEQELIDHIRTDHNTIPSINAEVHHASTFPNCTFPKNDYKIETDHEL